MPVRLPITEPKRGSAKAPLLTAPFATLLCAQFCFGFCFSIFLLLPKYLVTELEATPTQVGWVTAVAPLSALLCVPLVGTLLDRGRRRELMLGGALAMAIGSIAFLSVDRVGATLVALRALQGAAFTLTFNATATLTADLAPPARLGQALGWIGVSNLVTNAIAPAVVEPLARSHGWTPAFWLAFASAAVSALLMLLVPNAGFVQAERAEAPKALGARAWILAFVSAMIGVGFGTVITFTQPMVLAMGVRDVGGLFVGYTVAAVLVRVVFGGVADRFGRRRVAIVAVALYALVVGATALLRPGFLVPLGVGLGVAHGLAYPALSALAVEGARPDERGRSLSYFNGGFNAGFALCSFSFGAVVSAAGYPTVFGLAALLCASSVPFLVRLPERPPFQDVALSSSSTRAAPRGPAPGR